MRALFIAAALLVAHAAVAADASSAHRYQLSGTGTLRAAPAAQSGGTLRLNATLAPVDAALASSPPVQENERFALMAAISATPLVCYDDTIFRDDFDGDGF